MTPEIPASSTPLPAKRLPRLLTSALALLAVGAIAVAALSWYATTPAFDSQVRRRLVAALEHATGGRVELRAFHWHLLHLEFEADNLTIHGLEAPSDVPYAHIDRLFVRAKVISLFRAKVGLNLLQGESPIFHLIVYPDGSTNQPRPAVATNSGPVSDTLFNLAVDRTEISNGLLLLNQEAIPFDLAANDLAATVTYEKARDHYLADLRASDITTRRAKLPSVHSQLSLQADLGRNSAILSAFKLRSGTSPKQGSQLEAQGSLTNYADPSFQLTAKGSVDLREVKALTAVEGLESGVAELQIRGQGTLENFAVDGQAKVTGAAYRIPEVRVRGVNASAGIHITQEQISLSALEAHLPEGGSFDGELQLANWLAPTPAAPTRKDAVAAVARKSQNLPAPATPPVSSGSIRGQVRGVTMRSILRIAATPEFADIGFQTAASGSVSVAWTGNADDLKVSAKVGLTAGNSSAGIPLSGAIDATYYNGRGAVDIRNLVAQTPGSHLQVEGSLGVYPLDRESKIQADLTTGNLDEFDKTLRALGVSSNGPGGTKSGIKAIPIELHGQAAFHGTVTGSLVRPDVKGHLAATAFDTVFATAPATVAATTVATPVMASNTALPASAAQTTDIHWDSLDAQAEYSPEIIGVQQATLLRGKTTVHASGQIHVHDISRRKRVFDDQSALNANVSVQNASVADLLTIAGSTAPVSGILNVQAQVGGTLGNLNGGGHIAVAGGQIEGQSYRSLNTDLKFAGQELDATNLIFLQDGGQVTGDGGYDLRAKTIHFQAKGGGFELAHFPQLQRPKLSLAGELNFQATGSGSLEAPAVQAALHLTNLIVNGQFRGSLDADAHLKHGLLSYNVTSNIDAARLQLAGETTLTGNYPTQAKLTANQLHIGRFLQLFRVQDVSSDSILNLQAVVSGPARQPRQMQGSLEIDKFAISVAGIALRSDADLTAQLRNGILHLDPLHIAGDDTNLQAQGSVALFEDLRSLDFHASGAVNLKLAHSFDPNITSSGHMDFSVDAAGTLQQPSLTGQVRFNNGAIALGDLPNGLSQLNGTLVFDQDRLTVQQLTALTGGGRLSLGGAITYQQGIYADLTATGTDIRIRYPQGVSSMANAKFRLQGTETNLLLSGSVLVTRFSISPNLDLASLKASSSASGPPPDANAASNHLRLDIHITSAPELNFQNSFAKLAGDVDLRIRGTVADPALIGHITVTDGSATFAGTTYQLQRGEIYFSNPIHIDPVIDLDATARVEDYDIDVGLHGTLSKLNLTYRSEPPLPEADVFALLALGRTQEEQQIYSQEQSAAGVNSTADALLGGALNATVSSRVQKLFGVGSVKIDPTFVGNLGNSTARITVEEKVGKNATVTYATNVNSTAQQLIAGQLYITPNVSVVAQRDESGVFSMLIKIHQRHR